MRRRSYSAPLARLSDLRGLAPGTGDTGSGQGVVPWIRICAHERRAWTFVWVSSRLCDREAEVASVPQRPIVPGKVLLASTICFGVSRTLRMVSTNDSPRGEES